MKKILKRINYFFKPEIEFPSNVIMTSPHGSYKVPLKVYPHLTRDYQLSSRLLMNFSDYGTKYLLESVPEKQKIVAKYGRLVGDCNRKRKAEDIIRFDDFGGLPIFREKFKKRLTDSILRPFWFRKLMMYSYEPFFRDVLCAIRLASQDPKNADKPIILIDVHDVGNRILGRSWREDKKRDVVLPPAVLSNAPDLEIKPGKFGTAPLSFVEDFREKLADKMGVDLSEIEINSHYKGGHVTRYFGNPEAHKRLKKALNGKEIITMQIEFCRCFYMDEVTQRPYPMKTKFLRKALMETVNELCEEV